MPAVTTIRAQITAALSKAGDLGSPAGTLQALLDAQLANGTLDTQADRAWGDTRTVGISANDDLDLAGVLEDMFGDVFTLAEVAAIIIIASALNTNDLVVGNAAANPFVGPLGAAAHTIKVRPGGVLLLYAPGGWAVVAGTGDILRIANGAGSTSDYSIVVVGRSA
jgi:hypothetical protein